MTDLTLDEVNVYVVGVISEKTEPVYPEDLSKDDDTDDTDELATTSGQDDE